MEVRLPDAYALPQNLQQWIDKHKADFQPPVGNKMMSGVSSQFKIMLVAGPNTRTDYHIEDGEEFFYMLKGDMVLKIVDGGRFRDVPIREGEAFLLPARVPHSPQRFADTMGLVIERVRAAGEMDTLRWYCPRCRHILHQQSFPCTDLGKQLAPVIRAYYASDAMRTCRRCGCVDLPAGQSPDYGSAHIEAQYGARDFSVSRGALRVFFQFTAISSRLFRVY